MALVHEIIEKSFCGEALSPEEALSLYRTDPYSKDAFMIRWAALRQSMELAGGLAEIHAQIGLDSGPCPKDCQFCSFAACNSRDPGAKRRETPLKDVVEYAKIYVEQGANLILLLSTEAYDFDRYAEICVRVREAVGGETPLLANIGDLDLGRAKRLKGAGMDGIYHAVRLGEGEITGIHVETRLATIENAGKAGLRLSTCLEPIGPEHSAGEIEERARMCMGWEPMTSGVGRRVAAPGTGTARLGMLSQPLNALYAASYRLTDHRTKLIASVHSELMANSGSNLSWSEAGSNPRDSRRRTEGGRGRSVKEIKALFSETGWRVRRGPSPGWRD
ncbi:MAG: radical SAM protein [Clostridiales Family XIII bacterium]|jgi:biotin synthase|nr:radical SAM protein [Clostridiales Family XIII bacterium]